jgi:hypothetical protein
MLTPRGHEDWPDKRLIRTEPSRALPALTVPPPAVRRRDHPRADGDARRAEVPRPWCTRCRAADGAQFEMRRIRQRRRAATSTGRRPAACGCAGAIPSECPKSAGLGGDNALRASRCRPGGSGARRPRSVAATAAGGWRCATRKGRHPGTSARGHFTGRHCAAYTPVARLRRDDALGWPHSAGSRCHDALRAARRPAAPPAARCPLPVAATAAGGGGRARRGRRGRHPGTSAGGHFTGTPARSLHARGAGAPGDDFRLPASGGITRFAQSAPRVPFPAARRPRSVAAPARRADGDAHEAEGGRTLIHACAGGAVITCATAMAITVDDMPRADYSRTMRGTSSSPTWRRWCW